MLFDSVIYILLVVNALLGVAVLFRDSKQKVNQLFAGFVILVNLWIFSNFLENEPDIVGVERLGLFLRLDFALALFVFLLWFYFCKTFVQLSHSPFFDFVLGRTLLFLSGALALLSLLGSFILTDITFQYNIIAFKQGVLWPMYALLLLILTLGGLFYLLWGRIQTKQEKHILKQQQIELILLGFLLSAGNAVFINLFLQTFYTITLEISRFGLYGMTFLVGFTAYAVIRKRLLGIRIILTQLLVAVIGILLLINVFSSENSLEYTWKTFLLVTFLVAGYLLIKSVLNEIKQKEELQQTYKKLKELDEAKSEFVSIASHQLRTPLTAIKGYISMLLEGTYGKLSAKQEKPIDNIYESNERLIHLVNDLLNISRIESGRIKVEWQKAKLQEVVQSVIDELQIKTKEKKLKLSLEKPILLPSFNMDPAKIRNIVLNIIDNAIRYTAEGSITVTLSAQPENRNLPTTSALIKIQDTGEGMGQQELQHLFESFSRGRTGAKMWTEGAGLGLYIAKQVVNMHKGRIWAKSAGKGKGSTFFVQI